MEMQSLYVAPLPNSNTLLLTSFHFHLHHPHIRKRLIPSSIVRYQSFSKDIYSLPLHLRLIRNCNKKELHKYQTNQNKGYSDSIQNHHFFNTNITCIHNPDTQNQEQQQQKQEREETQLKKRKGLFTNMWWADLKAALGQRINLEGIVSSAAVFVKDRHLVLPQVAIADIRYIDWAELRKRGFKGVVFDKDNTITLPYSLTLWGPLAPSIEQCKISFGNDIAVFSNSAGLFEYDHDGSKARALEKAIGIKVIRHRVKKPAGAAEEIEKHFGYNSSQLIMVGDRPFTDIVYGNRNGFLTILTEPLNLHEEPFIVRQVRKVEGSLMNYWFRRGLKPISHCLLPDAKQCVKDSPTL